MSTLLIDSCDSVLTMNVAVKCVDEAIAERAADMWVHFYDAVPLTVGVGKSYDVKFVADGVKLSASFRTHVDTFTDVFGEEALEYLEEVAYVCEDDTFYVETPYSGGGYERILTHYITVGKTKAFVCCFGGEGLDDWTPLADKVEPVRPKTPFQLATPYQPEKASSQPTVSSKAQNRAHELGQMAYELGEEVRQLKEEVAALQAQIAEKEAQIRLYEYAQEELEAVAEE